MMLSLTADHAPTGCPSQDSTSTDIAAYEAIWMRVSTCTQVSTVFRRSNYDRPSRVAQAIGISAQEIETVRLTIAALMPFAQFAAVLGTSGGWGT